MTERYQVILAYDGAGFAGFQKQARSRTVQGVVEDALQRLGWTEKSLLAAGRTDTGVHASGQVIAFNLDWNHPIEDLLKALNANLPEDVAARQIELAREGFHPRYDALSRCYRYSLYCDAVRDPLLDRCAWRVWPPVDVQALQSAAAHLVGKHDFAAFGTPPRPNGSTVRRVYHAEWRPEGRLLVFEIAADAFLYHMVRRLVAVQVEIGQGRQDPEMMRRFLDRETEAVSQGLAPACGLVLAAVSYEKASVCEKDLKPGLDDPVSSE